MRHFLHHLILSLAVGLLLCTNSAFAQVHITPQDTTICNGQGATLHAANGAGTPASAALISDDAWSGAVSLGFTFNFYGTNYTQCWISPNGYISFTARTQGSTSWYNANSCVTGGTPTMPGNTDYLNCIFVALVDLLPSPSVGAIDYLTVGSAPNRQFVVNWCDVPHYGCTSAISSLQLVIFEGSNNIEMHIRQKRVCNDASPGTGPWNDVAVQGVQNAAGTIAQFTPGRGYPTSPPWTAFRDSRRFTPTSATLFQVDSIPYAPVSIAGGGVITWYDAANSVLGTGPTLAVNPTVSPTKYFARQIYCSDTTRDSTRVFIGGNPHVDSVQQHNPSYCGNNDGSLVLFGLQPNQNYNINYSKDGVPQPQITLGSSAQGTLTMANLSGGLYSSVRVSTTFCIATSQYGPYTLVNPHIPVNFTSSIQYVCSNNDIVTFTNTTPTPGAINYEYRFGDGNTGTTPNPVHTYVNQNNYPVTLVADNGVCHDSVINFVDTRHPLDAFFLVDHQQACQFQTLHFKDSSIITYGNGPQPQFSWDFGDGNSGTGTTPTHAYLNVGTYVVRLIVTDFVPCVDTFYRTITVGVPPTVSFVSSESIICEGKSSIFTGDFSSEMPTGYEWTFGDGTTIYNTNPAMHSYDSAGIYTIKLVTHYRYCPDTNYSLPITVQAFPGINLGPDTSLCPNASPVTLYNHADFGQYAGATYSWNTGATTPSINVNSEGTYGATINLNGCTASDSMTVFKDCYLDVPNSFTPNGDGLNDYFLPRQFLSRSVTGYKMDVYNRWGEVVFETTALDGRGWDGRFNGSVQPAGVYIYIIDVFFANGTKEHYTGNVTMIR